MAAARAGRAAPALALQNLAAEITKSSTPTSQSNPYRLVLLKQNCIGEEKYSKAGRTCMAKVVVKKSPFLIQFAMEALQAEHADLLPDLHHFQFDARLVYEYDETKEVDFVKVSPMDFKANISENGKQVNGEARINVLTSQLEDMLFRIRIKAEAKARGNTNPLILLLYSSPIKVVSKPDQVQKRRKKREEEAKRKAATVALASGLTPAAAGLPAPLFGHPVTDDMVRVLQTVERHQLNQQELLNKLIEQLSGRVPNIVLTPSDLLAMEVLGAGPIDLGDPQEIVDEDPDTESSDEPEVEVFKKRPRLEHLRGGRASVSAPPPAAAPVPAAAAEQPQEEAPEKVLDFEQAYSMMMGAYDNMTPEQRTEKIRSVILQTHISRESVSEIHDLFWAEGLQRALGDDAGGDSIMLEPIGRNNAPTASDAAACTCEDCPHKKELARIENFYREVFSLY